MVPLRLSGALFPRRRIRPVSLSRFFKTNASCCRGPPLTYTSDVDNAEPLDRYQPGGYHPIQLGDVLKDGRYKILHKLGWGGYSTTWAAKDQSEGQYVAIKVSVSDMRQTHELEILRAISALPRHHPGWSHLNHILDHFTVVGPNGTHNCFVLELVGPSVTEAVASHCWDWRLPAKLAKVFASQALQGLDLLASHGIGHGDVHTKNLAISIPDLKSLDERDFCDRLGEPETCPVSRLDGNSLSSNISSHVVRPASFRYEDVLSSSASVKIIDFGEAFFDKNAPNTLNTPLVLRPPEVLFGDKLDHRVDLWSAGCLLFELVTGQPPFDNMVTPPILVQQMMSQATGGLPSRWRDKQQALLQDLPDDDEDDPSYTLQEWLAEAYYFDNRHAEFTREDLVSVGKLIEGMLKFEPSLRATASDTLVDAWFNQV